MKLLLDPQAFARRFNEDESVWCCYEHKRELRLLLRCHFPLAEEILDEFDWLDAEEACRVTRCVGKPIHETIEAY